jgi:ferritin-like protein
MPAASTRRQLLAGGVGAAAGLSVIAPGVAWADSGDQSDSKLPPKVQDGKVLQRLLEAERLLQYGYEHALGSGYLKHTAQQLALQQLAHEQAHVTMLQEQLKALSLPNAALQKKSTEHFPPEDVSSLFKAAKHEKDQLQVIVQIENLAQSSYFKAAGGFHDRRLVRLAAEILACEAQHWTMLVDLLHKGDATRAVPHPTVRGSMHISKPHP